MGVSAGVRQGTYALAVDKINFLDRIPYLFARLREPGVKERCLQQWRAAPLALHQRVSCEFLQPGHSSGLRAHVDQVPPDGTNVHPDLATEIESIANIPLDDSVGEGPHAKATAIGRRATGC